MQNKNWANPKTDEIWKTIRAWETERETNQFGMAFYADRALAILRQELSDRRSVSPLPHPPPESNREK